MNRFSEYKFESYSFMVFQLFCRFCVFKSVVTFRMNNLRKINSKVKLISSPNVTSWISSILILSSFVHVLSSTLQILHEFVGSGSSKVSTQHTHIIALNNLPFLLLATKTNRIHTHPWPDCYNAKFLVRFMWMRWNDDGEKWIPK